MVGPRRLRARLRGRRSLCPRRRRTRPTGALDAAHRSRGAGRSRAAIWPHWRDLREPLISHRVDGSVRRIDLAGWRRRRSSAPIHVRPACAHPRAQARPRGVCLRPRRRVCVVPVRDQAGLRQAARSHRRHHARRRRELRRRPLHPRRLLRPRRPEQDRTEPTISRWRRRPRARRGRGLRRAAAPRRRDRQGRPDPRRHPRGRAIERRPRQGPARPVGGGASARVTAGLCRSRRSAVLGGHGRVSRHRHHRRRRRRARDDGQSLRRRQRLADRVAEVEPGSSDHRRRRRGADQGHRSHASWLAPTDAAHRGPTTRHRRYPVPPPRGCRAVVRTEARRGLRLWLRRQQRAPDRRPRPACVQRRSRAGGDRARGRRRRRGGELRRRAGGRRGDPSAARGSHRRTPRFVDRAASLQDALSSGGPAPGAASATSPARGGARGRRRRPRAPTQPHRHLCGHGRGSRGRPLRRALAGLW